MCVLCRDNTIRVDYSDIVHHSLTTMDHHPSTKEVKPSILGLVEELEDEVQQDLEEENNRSFLWLEQCDITIREFRRQNPTLMLSLEDELDIGKWIYVAESLGLSSQEIERCDKDISGSFTRNVFTILETRPKYRNLTLKDFLETLLKYNRRDILLKIEKYARLGAEICSTKTFNLSIQRKEEVMVNASSIGNNSGQRLPFMAKVLVVHARDAKEDALQLVSQLRNLEAGVRPNVLLLQESARTTVTNSLSSAPWDSIHKWFTKMDVVVPVLSPQFLLQIQNRDLDTENRWEKRYNRFVYTLSMNQCVDQGVMNFFCRPVCPAKLTPTVMANTLVRSSPLFSVIWNCSSEEEMEKFAVMLHTTAVEFRELKRKWKKEKEKKENNNVTVNKD